MNDIQLTKVREILSNSEVRIPGHVNTDSGAM